MLARIFFFSVTVLHVNCNLLVPKLFNLAAGSKITATATCGQRQEEEYCKIFGLSGEQPTCGRCRWWDDPNSFDKELFKPEFAIAGEKGSWMSPPFSSGDNRDEYEKVNLTIHFDQVRRLGN